MWLCVYTYNEKHLEMKYYKSGYEAYLFLLASKFTEILNDLIQNTKVEFRIVIFKIQFMFYEMFFLILVDRKS